MSENRQVFKVAVIGCGRMGALTTDACRAHSVPGYLPISHAEAVTTMPGFNLVALCDIDSQNLSKASALYSVKSTYSDYKLLVQEIKPDVVSVATRTPERCEIIRYSAKHGARGIYAEKPFSRSLAECDSTLEILRQFDCKLVCGTMRRFMPIYSIASAACRSGELGDVSRIMVEYGKSLLMWSHPHSIDAFLFLSGQSAVREVRANCEIPKHAIDNLSIDADPLVKHATVSFDSGLLCEILGNQKYAITVQGTKGELLIYRDGEMLRITAQGTGDGFRIREYWAKDFTGPSGTQRGFLNLAEAISSHGATAFSFEEVSLTQRLLLSIAWSQLSGGNAVDPFALPQQLIVSGKWNNTFA